MQETTTAKTTFEENASIVDWVHRYGCAMSEALLDADCKVFRIPDVDGFIGYRSEGSCAVVLGDPVCPKEDWERLASAFYQFCKDKHWNVAYIGTSKEFSHWAVENHCKVLLEICEEQIFDPQHDPTSGNKGHKLRYKVNHAIHLGIKVQEYLTADEQLEKSIQAMGDTWVKGRKGPQIYLSRLDFFEHRKDRRWFYAQQGQKIIGAALLCKLEANKGWLLKFLIALPDAPAGTSELIMTTVLTALRKENCRYLTYGIIPLEQIGEIVGLGKFTSWLARWGFKLIKSYFHLNQRKIYWQKFHPQNRPAYMLFSNPRLNLSEIKAVMQTLKID
jgi:lysylphosphatidylglycerol synthetase-like protein (DUF2156 family)